MLIKRIKYAGDIFEALVKQCEWDIDTASAFLESIPDAPNASLRPKGEWISVEDEEQPCDEWDCTACGQRRTFLCEMDADDMKEHYPFCPNCGADMRGETHDS